MNRDDLYKNWLCEDAATSCPIHVSQSVYDDAIRRIHTWGTGKMTSSVTMLLLGGLISLVSALATIYLQHRLTLQRLSAERRHHPFTVVYDKQTAFFDALAPLFLELNSYITTIDVWLGETTAQAPARVREAVANSGSVQKLEALIDQYYMYLPENLLRQVKDFHSKCFDLTQAPNSQLTYKAIHELFALQNDIR